jgi:HTH-type transcriptional regulator / antitoxin HigA
MPTARKATATEIEKYAIHDIDAPRVITSEAQYDKYANVLHSLVMAKTHTPETRHYIKLLIVLIEAWDNERHAIDNATPVEVVRTLMAANNLKQKDLAPIFGTESIVSEILKGKRKLNTDHIAKLSKRFKVSPAVFFA